ncbi:MAG TPA: ATP-binding protein [Verrucomicrobiota bacterium]|nr:ATP-binding protein [Verrucomicrobiota bacterium]
MLNRELDFPLPDGRAPLPGFRLRRLEMLNWGTFHEKVAVLVPDGRWTLLVGENGSGKSTAVDALRTLLVPPRLLNYNDASADQKRRGDRTRHTYIRGVWATVSQEDSAKARPEYLRPEGVQSILLAAFANEHSGEVVTLAQILWELNESVDERFAIALGDRNIKDDLANLGQTRELMKNLRQRKFEPFDSFTAYAKTFCTRLGITNDAALEVFNQAIGVKEIGDINHFIRRHMLESSDAIEFIRKRLRPHFDELDACWKAIEKAQTQLDALLPIATAHQKSEEAKQKRQHFQTLLDAVPLYYARRHLVLREEEAAELAMRLNELRRQKQEIEDVRKRDENERDAKLQEIAADSTHQSIARIDAQMNAADERRKIKLDRWNGFAGHLRTLNRLVPIESSEQFERVREEVSAQQGLVKGNRDSAQEKQVQQLMERQRAIDDRGRVSAELDPLRKHRVLIPREFVTIREAACAATKVSVIDLPFAGELIEVKAEHRDWTGAIERLLHQFGVSLLVPERHYVAVADFINRQHLGLRFTFHRVPFAAAMRADSMSDAARVAGRLNFRDEHPLAGWVKSEVSRRFNHVCCGDVSRLKEVDYGITREGLIRDGPTRHTKDDRRAVNDATNYVLGWSVEDKIRALTVAFQQAESREKQATQKAAEAAEQIKKLDGQLVAIQAVLGLTAFADIDHESEKREFARLKQEKDELEASSNALKALRKQLDAIKVKLKESEEALEKANQEIWSSEKDAETNKAETSRLTALLKPHKDFEPEPFTGELTGLQEKPKLSLSNIGAVEGQVSVSIDRQMRHQTGLINEANESMLPLMANFLRDNHFPNLAAEVPYAAEFVALRLQIEKEELPQHKQRFEEFLGTNLIGDMAMFQSNLLEHEKDIRRRVEAVNESLVAIPFSDTTHVQITAPATRADDIKQFRARLKECLRGGLQPSADDRLHIFKSIRELIGDFEKDENWTRHVTDARHWFEFGVSERANSDKNEVQYYSASSGKSGGQKAKLAFTILASAISAQYGLLGADSETNTFRLVVIDEVFARTDEANSLRALRLFQKLGLQLVVVNPFDAKGRIVEDFVDSFHLAVNPDGNNSKLRRASRAEYDAAVDGAAVPTPAAAQPLVTNARA